MRNRLFQIKIMAKIARIGFKIILFPFLLIILYLNISLYYQPSFATTIDQSYNQSVYFQLQFLKDALKNQNAGGAMQQLYPEGFVFINALYALSWADLIQHLTVLSDVYQEGVEEINWAYQEIDSEDGRMIFDANLPLKYGVFYCGWRNYVLGTKLKTHPLIERDSTEIQQFIRQCDTIAVAFSNSPSPFLESYSQQIWPADMTVAMASLAIHDQIFPPKYSIVLRNWVRQVKTKLDESTNLIPHQTDLNGQVLEGARGSSQSLILNFLKEIDPIWGKQQFEQYQNLFLTTRLGLPGVLEYPKGQNGAGDIDSGPVIWGVGGAASIVGQRTMAQYNNWMIYEGLRNSIETFGVGYISNYKKQYLFGELPMADAFIAWSNVMEYQPNLYQNHMQWRRYFHLLSAFIGVLLLYLLFGRLKFYN